MSRKPKLGLAPHPLRLRVVAGRLPFTFPFPYNIDTETDTVELHVSSAVVASSWFRFTDKARKRVKAYAREAAKTYKRTDDRDDYDYAQDFGEAYVARDYQLLGMHRLYVRVRAHQTGSVLADDVGLGKTPQALGAWLRLKREGLCGSLVVVAPNSVKTQWADEIRRFVTNPPKVSVIHGDRKRRLEAIRAEADVYIFNYELARLPQYADAITKLVARLKKRKVLFVIDESSAIKNPESKTHAALKALTSGSPVIALNATPIENNLADYYAQARMIDASLVGGPGKFYNRYITRLKSGKVVGHHNLKECKLRTAAVFYRRTRELVKDQLPDLITELRVVEMDRKQDDHYASVVRSAIIEGSSGAVKMSKLLPVQRAALISDGAKPESAKLDDLDGLLGGDLAHEKVVVFSRFKTCARIAAKRLEHHNTAVIDGDTTDRNRTDIRRRFSDKSNPLRVLIVTEAMDRGVNLQAAGVLVNLDLPWNAAKLRQRVGRIARLSQERSAVLIINYAAARRNGKPTIDDYFVGIVDSKRDLHRRMLGDADVDELGNEERTPQGLFDFIKTHADTTR